MIRALATFLEIPVETMLAYQEQERILVNDDMVFRDSQSVFHGGVVV